MNSPIIINFCPTGMVPTKINNSHVPISPSEIIEQTHEAYEIGITIAHLHAREADQTPTHKASIYQLIFEGIRKHCPDLVICASSSGRNVVEFEKRAEVLALKPDMCSLTLSSLNFLHQASVNSPDVIIALAQRMQEHGVVPELECFDLGMINYGKYLINKGILQGPYYWNLLFGNVAGFQSNLLQVGTALAELANEEYVSLAGLGDYQLPINSLAVAMGYGVRIGLEDNIWWDKQKTIPASNIDLLKRLHQLMLIHEKTTFSSVDFGKKGFYNAHR